MPIQTACPELTEADNKTRMEGMDLLCSHGDGEMLSFPVAPGAFLSSFFMFCSQGALVSNSHTVTN